MGVLRIAGCQINPVVGDIKANARKISELTDLAKANGASIAVFPELAISGYPPEDLLAKPSYVQRCQEALLQVASGIFGITAVIGTVEHNGPLYNSAAVIDGGRVVAFVRKEILPNYLVFDEKRYFTPGSGESILFEKDGVKFAISICEDAWFADGPISKVAKRGAEVVININASPYSIGKRQERAEMLNARSKDNGVAIVYLNQVGGQDELVFDGASMVYDSSGSLIKLAESFVEEIMYVEVSGRSDSDQRPSPESEVELPAFEVVSLPKSDNGQFIEKLHRLGEFFPVGTQENTPTPLDLATSFSPLTWVKKPFIALSKSIERSMALETYQALELGTRDYVGKNGFQEVVLGLSGGIDSALVATIAADALGPDRVHCVAMPSRYSSESSVTDAKQLADNLGTDFIQISIEKAHQAYLEISEETLRNRFQNITEENLQSRLRGVLLMALSNQRNWLVLTTGNKSELATGYSTLYGDTAGGFGVIKDLSKTMVYRLASLRNELAGKELIPESILLKAPSAELRPDQRDDQSLPAYEILDPIVEALVELDFDTEDLIKAGFDREMVIMVARLIDLNEYKRRQNPPGVRVTQRAFGKDRRVPITNGYIPWKMEN